MYMPLRSNSSGSADKGEVDRAEELGGEIEGGVWDLASPALLDKERIAT